MATTNKTVKEKLATLGQARVNAVNPMTFMFSEADAGSGASIGGLGSNYLANLNVYAIQTYVDKATGTVTRANNKFGNIDVSNITAQNITCNDITINGTVSDGTPRNGFIGRQEDIANKFSFVFDENTRVAVLSYTDQSDIEVYVDDVKIVIPDGDPLLTAAAIPNDFYGWYTYYINSDGQLSWTTTPFDDFFSTNCLVMSLLFAPDNAGIPGEAGYPRATGSSISQLIQHHGAESIDWREVHHRTEGSKIAEPCGFVPSTTSTPTIPTSILSLTEGTMYDEDVWRTYPAVDGSTDPWVCYYYDGITASVPDAHRGFKDLTNLSQIYVTSAEAGLPGGDSNIIYSNVTYDGNGVPTGATATRVPDNYYADAHIFVGMGPLVSNVIVMGQSIHPSLDDARDNLEADARSLYTSTTLLSEAVLVGSLILDHLGNIMPINNDGLMVADQRACTQHILYGGSDEVVVPDGTGNIRSTRSISLGSITSEEQLVLDYLATSPGEFLFTGANGSIGSFDLLGSESGSESTTDTSIAQQTTASTSPTTYLEVLSVTIPSDYIGMSFTYSIDSFLFSATQGMYVRVLINAIEYQEDLYDSVFSGGSPINITKTIANGPGTAGDVITVEVKAKKNRQTCTVEAGSYLTVLGVTGSTGYFLERVDGVASGSHTFENLEVTGDLTVSGNLNLTNLATSDPGIPGRVYRIGSELHVSL